MIEIEKTSNENVINFYCDAPLLKTGESDYADHQCPPQTALLTDIFATNFIKRALLLPDMLFIEKNNDAPLETVETLVAAFISDATCQNAADNIHLLKKIEALIEARIRPFLHQHGGDTTIISFENGKLTLRFEGHCQGCVHANQTLTNVIKTSFNKYLPQIKAIELEK